MGVTIELADRTEDECSCCGGRLIRLTRFVHRDGAAHAVYYGDFSPDHPERSVRVVLSMGEWAGWDGGKAPAARVAFALRIRATEAEFQVMVVDAVESPWHDVKALGKMLNRKNALAHPWIQEVFHITDHIVTQDRDVKEYLEGQDGGRRVRRVVSHRRGRRGTRRK
jgi:hypothetical protein